MALIRVIHAKPANPPIDSVHLTLTPEEAGALAALLGRCNDSVLSPIYFELADVPGLPQFQLGSAQRLINLNDHLVKVSP